MISSFVLIIPIKAVGGVIIRLRVAKAAVVGGPKKTRVTKGVNQTQLVIKRIEKDPKRKIDVSVGGGDIHHHHRLAQKKMP